MSGTVLDHPAETGICVPPNVATHLQHLQQTGSITLSEAIASAATVIKNAADDAFGRGFDLQVHIDPKGNVRITQTLTVVEVVTNERSQISAVNAQKIQPGLKLGVRFVQQVEFEELQTPFGVLRPTHFNTRNISLVSGNG